MQYQIHLSSFQQFIHSIISAKYDGAFVTLQKYLSAFYHTLESLMQILLSIPYTSQFIHNSLHHLLSLFYKPQLTYTFCFNLLSQAQHTHLLLSANLHQITHRSTNKSLSHQFQKALKHLQTIQQSISNELQIVQVYLKQKEEIIDHFQEKIDSLLTNYDLMKSDSYFLYHYFRFQEFKKNTNPKLQQFIQPFITQRKVMKLLRPVQQIIQEQKKPVKGSSIINEFTLETIEYLEKLNLVKYKFNSEQAYKLLGQYEHEIEVQQEILKEEVDQLQEYNDEESLNELNQYMTDYYKICFEFKDLKQYLGRFFKKRFQMDVELISEDLDE